ncbi:MAG TPA: hypothetical protein VGM88_29845 [Kofleriaceae bacterium]|jgi:hypothetical protein
MPSLPKSVAFALLALAACHGKKSDTTPKEDPADAGIPKVDPTLCDTNGKNTQTGDLNHDGKPDIWTVYKTDDEGGTKVEFMTCKQIDFNHDGKKDWVTGYNRQGKILFQKADLDFDGKWDYSAVFDPKTGVVAEVERSGGFDGKYDAKEIYDSAGQLVSIRRDRNGDGQPDVWEQYKDGILIAILYDDDFDGKVDRREEIPGAHPKVEMPSTPDPTATDSINAPAAAPTKSPLPKQPGAK